MLVRIGIKYMEIAHVRLLSKWNRQYFRAFLFDFCGKNVLSVLPVWSKAKIKDKERGERRFKTRKETKI